MSKPTFEHYTSNIPPPVASSSGIQFTRDADLLIRSFLPENQSEYLPPYQRDAGLPLSLCIPQNGTRFDSPFVRGYNPVLAQTVDISQAQLLSFVDGLNLAMTASPPLRVVNVAGMVIGFVPYHWAIIAGAGMQVAAQTGMRVLSKTLTDRYLRAANLRLFKPRGLSVRLCTTAAMLHLVANAENRKAKSKNREKLDKAGRAVGGVLLKLPLPITSRIVRAIADPAPKISPSAVGTKNAVILRRLAVVEGYALPLDLNVPPPDKAQGVMDTMSSWGVKFDEFMVGRRNNKAEESRRALAAPQSSQFDGMNLGMRRDRRAQRREGRRQQRGGLVTGLVGLKETKLERKVANADLAEHWATDQVLWIVVMSADKDDEIVGIDIAEGPADEERINEETWQAELAIEREEEEDEYESEEERLAEGAHNNERFGRKA